MLIVTQHYSEADIKQTIKTVPRQSFINPQDPHVHFGHSTPNDKTLIQVVSQSGVHSQAEVLHVGVGSGYFTAVLSQLVKSVRGVENNPALANMAKERFEALGLGNIEIITADAASEAHRDQRFDVIFISSTSIGLHREFLLRLKRNGQLLTIEEDERHNPLLIKYSLSEVGRIHREDCGIIDIRHNTTQILSELGLFDDKTLEQAQQLALQQKRPIIEVLRQLTRVDDTKLFRSLAIQANMSFLSIDELAERADPEFFAKFSRSFLEKSHLIPIRRDHENLEVASNDPDAAFEEISRLFPCHQIHKVLMTPNDFRRLWSMLDLCLQGELKQLQPEKSSTEPEISNHLSVQSALHSHLTATFDALLTEAVNENASDIHIEQYHGQLRVRLRVDGELYNVNHYSLSPDEIKGLINVIKIRADMNIAEKRLPQGGRSSLSVNGKHYDLRIQVQPSQHGEFVVIRLLAQNTQLLSIEDLGLSSIIAERYRRLLNNPAGLVLVVGPTGSGKSTTLYAGLQLLAEDGLRKVITVEDPIEYSIDGVQQTQVKPDIGFHFSDAMRSFVRQDPDVILVGEIRDQETALEAVRASQTGHVVLSTLHCNDATDSLQRLYDLNINANSIASELLAVIAQRLAKRICPSCRQAIEPDPAIIKELFPSGTPKNFQCFEGKGCSHCDGKGTKGRVGVIEFMQVNRDVRHAISQQPSITELRAIALDSGLISMRDSALDHVINGLIPLSELPRILPENRMAPEVRGKPTGRRS